MALKPKGNLLVIAALLAVATLIWSSSGVISARTRTIGTDRIVSFESLPEDDVCVMPGMESESLPAAIVAVENRLPKSNGLVCALPTASPVAASASAAAQEAVPGAGTAYQAQTRQGQINKKPARYIKDPAPPSARSRSTPKTTW